MAYDLAAYWESVRSSAADRGARVPGPWEANNAGIGAGARAGFQKPTKQRGPKVPAYSQAQVRKL
jgi:hypothetical protein